MGIQELFTELKKITVVPRYEPAKSRRISRNFAKCMGNPGIWGVWKFPSKHMYSSPFCPYFLIFGQKLAFWNTKRTCFLDFWYFLILGHFWGHFEQNLVKNLVNGNFWLRMTPEMAQVKKYGPRTLVGLGPIRSPMLVSPLVTSFSQKPVMRWYWFLAWSYISIMIKMWQSRFWLKFWIIQ